jgi:GTP-binding protein Era
MIKTRSGFVAVIGRPNAGKSSLLNYIIRENLTIVSQKANATRKRVNIIHTYEDTQIIFIDTPGIHQKEKLLNKFMLDEAIKASLGADLILFLSPASDSTKEYLEFLKLIDNKEHILLLTKVDAISNDDLLDKIKEYNKFSSNYKELIPISIKKRHYVDYMLKAIASHIPSSPFYYDEETITTQTLRDIFKELIREAIFDKLSEELPYESDVIISDVKEQKNITKIYAKIVVDKNSQKGMVIGKNGATIKRIGISAREKIEKIIDNKSYLEISVIVKKGWTTDRESLKELGYEYDN